MPELQEIAQSELDRLRALEQPEYEADQLDPTYFALLEDQIALLGELGDAASAEDPAGARDVVDEAAALNSQAAAIATAYGIFECAEGDGGEEPDASPPSAPTPPSTSPPDISTASSAQAFAAAANEICADSRAELTELSEAETEEEASELLAALIEISSEEARRLGELEAPGAVQTRFSVLLELREQHIAALERVEESLLADDRAAAGEALGEATQLGAAADLLELELGFNVCGTDPVDEIPNQNRVPESDAHSEKPG